MASLSPAGEGGDILQHFLSSVAEARSLDGDAGEGAAQLVEHERGERLALDVLGDDQKLSAALHDLLEHGQDLLRGGDLLIGDEDQRIVKLRNHLVGIGDHIGCDVAAVEHHALDDLAVGVGSFALLDGDDAVGGDLLHRLGDQLADEFIL